MIYQNDSKIVNENKSEETSWYLLGKVDGLYFSEDNPEENTVIEIKNRIYRYFYELREYEKIQTYCYMFILGYKKAHLVESLKNMKCDINIINVEFDDEYWEEMHIGIITFINYFQDVFMKDEELREELILDEENFIVNL